MPRNVYFSQAVKSEQQLYEDLIIESLKIYGQDVYYIPRTLVNRDNILGEDSASKFDDAYLIEAYIENIDGFEGAGDLFSKFGVEIRDEAQFIISRKVWERRVGIYERVGDAEGIKPVEGDLLFLPMTNSFFEITFVEDDKPFYQLSDLPVYKLSCALFEYSEEDFDTGVQEIDEEINTVSYQQVMRVNITENIPFKTGEDVKQIHVAEVKDNSGNVTTAEVATIGEVANVEDVSSTQQRLFISNIGVTNSTEDKGFFVSTTVPLKGITSGNNGFIFEILSEVTDSSGLSFATDEAAMNYEIEAFADGFIDFSEANPFGDPSETY
tara:strand:- start:3899 stop:4873 length:975 start_codon:yes stop_codon:yes gene_type:complete